MGINVIFCLQFSFSCRNALQLQDIEVLVYRRKTPTACFLGVPTSMAFQS